MNDRRSASVYAVLLSVSCAALLLLPFVTTFDDLLTTLAIRLGLDRSLGLIPPIEARMAVAALRLVGIPAMAHTSQVLFQSSAYSQPLAISWNCAGWQSLVLLGLSLATGLRGTHPVLSRFQVVAFGLGGTVLVNVARIALVCLLAETMGYVPAVLFHDYGGTFLTMGWLFGFWAIAYRWILVPATFRSTP